MKKILIIDDHELFRKSISEMLRNENYKVYTAEDGIQGLKLAEEICPDVILCEIIMPGIDGYEVLKKMTGRNPAFITPFIFLTGLTGRKDFRQGMTLGADDFLTKPFTRAELLETISCHLRKCYCRENHIISKINEFKIRTEKLLSELKAQVDDKNNLLSHFSNKTVLLGKKLEEKEYELIKETFSAIETNNTLQEIKNKIKLELINPLLTERGRQILIRLKNLANKKNLLNNDWTKFQIKFNLANPNLISKLTTHFPDLTQYEIVFISAHIIGFNTCQLADLFNITNESVRKSRYRLKKKLGLKKEEDLLQFIHNLNLEQEFQQSEN